MPGRCGTAAVEPPRRNALTATMKPSIAPAGARLPCATVTRRWWRGTTSRCWTLAGLVLFLVGALPPASAAAATVTRRAGDDRYATAAAVSQASFAPGVERAVVATGEAPFDALAGA